MKKRMALLLVLALTGTMAGCGAQDVNPAGKIYTYENSGFGSHFTINIYEDGSFQYYEGLLSSYIGMGDWSLDDSILTLTEGELGRPAVNRFRVSGDDLAFIAEDSDNFIYITVEDGALFHGVPFTDEET